MSARHSLALPLVAALSLGLISCDKAPIAPEGGGAAAVSRIEIPTPPIIAPGESVQLSVRAITTGGVIENVIAGVQWSSSSPVLQITPQGLATGREPGESVVTAQFEGRSATANVLVLPRGAFRLSGRVIDSSDLKGIEGVVLTVATGVGAGQRATSAANGVFSLYGVAGEITIRAEKSGYTFKTFSLAVTGHLTHEFPMARGSYIGVYALTIHTGSCAASFPDAARRREYAVEVSSETSIYPGFPNQLVFAFPGPNFIVTNGSGNSFYGSITPRDAVLNLEYHEFCDSDFGPTSCGYQLMERFGDDALAFNAVGWGSGTLEAASGPMFGEILIFDETRAPFSTVKSRCKTDRFVLQRR